MGIKWNLWAWNFNSEFLNNISQLKWNKSLWSIRDWRQAIHITNNFIASMWLYWYFAEPDFLMVPNAPGSNLIRLIRLFLYCWVRQFGDWYKARFARDRFWVSKNLFTIFSKDDFLWLSFNLSKGLFRPQTSVGCKVQIFVLLLCCFTRYVLLKSNSHKYTLF